MMHFRSKKLESWFVLVLVSVVAALFLLDDTIFGPALPTIQEDLQLSATASHWIVNAYLLVFASTVALGGKILDRRGLPFVINTGACIFILGSILGGSAQSDWMILLARAVQGLGAGLLYPVASTTIAAMFPPEKRGMALGIMASIGTTFLALGPLIGGLLTEYASWRWIFWFNIPILLLAWPTVIRRVPRPEISKSTSTPDRIGLVLLLAGLSLFVFGIMEAPAAEKLRWITYAAIIVGICVLSAFYRHEKKTDSPLIDVSVFRNLSMVAGGATVFTAQYCKLTITIFIALYYHDVVGLSAAQTGAATFASVAAAPVVAVLAGRIADRYPARALIIGALTTAGCALLIAALFIHLRLLYPTLLILFVWGCTLSFSFLPSMRLIINQTPKAKHGEVMGIYATTRIMGATFGIAVSSMILSLTGSYSAVLIVAVLAVLVTLGFAWFAIREDRETNGSLPTERSLHAHGHC